MFGCNGMVVCWDDGWDVGEKMVGFYFVYCLLDGFGVKGILNFFEGEELVGCSIFDEVYVWEIILVEMS